MGLLALALVLFSTGTGPTNTVVPAVSGTAQAGKQLNASSGTWTSSGTTITYAFQWSRCDATGAGCVAVKGATTPSYALAAADVGKTIGLTVTATDSAGKATADASLLGPIVAPNAPLASTVRPAIGGSAKVGATLVASAGIWTPTPKSVTYAWERCNATGRACLAIAGAVSSTYVPVAADVGHELVVRVLATSGSVTENTFSIATAPVGATVAPTGLPTSTRPVVTGTAKVGRKLAGPAGAAGYQWYRCDAGGSHCTSIHGATGMTYTLVAKDAARTIGLSVKGTSTTYASLVGPIAASTSAVASTTQPVITGSPVQGQTLSAAQGAPSYAWQRCNQNGRACSAIEGATAATYVPTSADVGHALVVLVGGTFSIATDPIQPPPALGNTVAPAVNGTAEVDQRLVGSTGTWTGPAPIAFKYQWYRCDENGAQCSSVHGATGTGYRLGAADGGHTIGLTVTATDSTGVSKPAYASLVGPIGAATATAVSTVQPKTTGSTKVGAVLSTDLGTWSPVQTAFAYQWLRCNANGRACTAIAGATSATYTVATADVGHAMLAIVTAGDGKAFSTASAAATN